MTKARTLRTVGLSQGRLGESIAGLLHKTNPTVELIGHDGMVDISLAARSASEAEADRMLAGLEAEVRARIGAEAIYGTGSETLEGVTAGLLAQAGLRLALVESATGGEVARRLSGTLEGAAAIAAAHVVGTAEELAALLDVSPALMETYGWISQMAAATAAAHLCDTYEGGWGLAVLGSQSGGTYAALFSPDNIQVRHYPEDDSEGVAARVIDLVRQAAIARLQAKG